uniref:hypothetical protein n=1 Tax=Trinickia acidisoli TaxID=2767482 RepID=UPI002852E9E6|nr:hypothetical protein [Trinickia acidisoli]
MPRRKSTSPFDDLVVVAAKLPWWLSVILAAVTYAVLHRFATAGVSTNVAMAQVGQMVVHQMIKVLATFGQYLIPLALLAGAAASYFGRRKRVRLVHDAAQTQFPDALRNINWRDFELLVGEVFRMRGFVVTEAGGGGADGGST